MKVADEWTWSLELPHYGEPIVAPNGEILVAGESNYGQYLQSISRDGTPGWALDELVYPRPVFDALGNVYWPRNDGTQVTTIVSYRDGELRWEHPMKSVGSILDLVVGADGNLYTLAEDRTDYGSNWYLWGLAASDGRTLVRTPIDGWSSELFSYPGGLIAVGSKINYLSRSGKPLMQYDRPVGGQSSVSASANGALFVGTLPNSLPTCGSSAGHPLISKFRPGIGIVWTYEFPWQPDCQRDLGVFALPNGGVVATIDESGASGSPSLTALSSAGTLSWSRQPPTFPDESLLGGWRPHVDVNGRVVVANQIQFSCQVDNRWDLCGGIQLDQFDQDTGDLLAESIRIIKPDPNPESYFSHSFAIDDGRAYVSASHLDGGYSDWQTATYPLYALNIPGLAREYPDLFSTPPEGDRANPVVYVHGIDPFSGDGMGHNGRKYWGDMKKSFAERGWRTQRTVAYYIDDEHFDNSIDEYGKGPKADRHQKHHGTPLEHAPGNEREHDNNTDIGHLAYHWAWYVYKNFTEKGVAIKAVGHSMGGLIIRYALTRVERGHPDFPPELFVEDVVTLGTPHAGTDVAVYCDRPMHVADQCQQMRRDSSFIQNLGANPQATGGTDWTAEGSFDDEALIPYASAVGMRASHKVMYLDQIWPCSRLLIHNCYMHTTSNRLNADVKYKNAGEWVVDRSAPWPVRWSDRALRTKGW